jgi:hypothetical protein
LADPLRGVPQGRILEKIQEWRDKYGPVFRVWYERYRHPRIQTRMSHATYLMSLALAASTTPTLFLTDPELVKNLLNGQTDVNYYSKARRRSPSIITTVYNS